MVAPVSAPGGALRLAQERVTQWLQPSMDRNYSRNRNCETKMAGIFEAIASARSPVGLPEVLSMLPEMVTLIHGRAGIPLLNWPWFLEEGGLSDLQKDRNMYLTIVDVLERTRGKPLYVRGNGLRLYTHWKGSGEGDIFYLAQNEEFHEEAPKPGSFVLWYTSAVAGRQDGDGLTLNSSPSRPSIPDGHYHHFVPREFSVLCAIARSREDVDRLAVFLAISVMMVQAVSLSQGGSPDKVYPEVHALFKNDDQQQIGAQIAILAAVYSCLTSPYDSFNLRKSTRYATDAPDLREFVSIAEGLDSILLTALSANMHWIKTLGKDVKRVRESGEFEILGIGSALFVRDNWHPVRWFGCSAVIIVLISVSVLFQSIGWV